MDRRKLEGDVQVFMSEKVFEGCGELSLADEIRVSLSGQACLLLLHRSFVIQIIILI
jgi:Mlc titration factor MtfA (ptsG expression regulator)